MAALAASTSISVTQAKRRTIARTDTTCRAKIGSRSPHDLTLPLVNLHVLLASYRKAMTD